MSPVERHTSGNICSLLSKRSCTSSTSLSWTFLTFLVNVLYGLLKFPQDCLNDVFSSFAKFYLYFDLPVLSLNIISSSGTFHIKIEASITCLSSKLRTFHIPVSAGGSSWLVFPHLDRKLLITFPMLRSLESSRELSISQACVYSTGASWCADLVELCCCMPEHSCQHLAKSKCSGNAS